MAKLCVEGMKATYSYCDQHDIPYKKVFILKVTECLSVCVTVAKVLQTTEPIKIFLKRRACCMYRK